MMVANEFVIDDLLSKEASARATQKSGLVGLVQRFAGARNVSCVVLMGSFWMFQLLRAPRCALSGCMS